MIPLYGIIPARYKSTRLEGKPLANIHGKPMFWHVYQRALQSKLHKVYLATDDERIALKAHELSVPCIMTSTDLKTGSERVLQAAQILNFPEEGVLVNIQGDEPMLEPEMINELILPFSSESNIQVSTLVHKISENEQNLLSSPNLVKVVFSKNNTALYFSRTLIPYVRDEENRNKVDYYSHIGIYAFTFKALKAFASLPQSNLEKLENLEQLRFLENNIPITVVPTSYTSLGVDTLEDLEYVRKQIGKSI